jgi:hypothetical protein
MRCGSTDPEEREPSDARRVLCGVMEGDNGAEGVSDEDGLQLSASIINSA